MGNNPPFGFASLRCVLIAGVAAFEENAIGCGLTRFEKRQSGSCLGSRGASQWKAPEDWLSPKLRGQTVQAAARTECSTKRWIWTDASAPSLRASSTPRENTTK